MLNRFCVHTACWILPYNTCIMLYNSHLTTSRSIHRYCPSLGSSLCNIDTYTVCCTVYFDILTFYLVRFLCFFRLKLHLDSQTMNRVTREGERDVCIGYLQSSSSPTYQSLELSTEEHTTKISHSSCMYRVPGVWFNFSLSNAQSLNIACC